MIDRNVFLFEQIVFMLNFALCFGYGLSACRGERSESSPPNVKTGLM